MKDKVVIGINMSHDISCAAVVNGEVKVAIEEERLNRWKHCDGKTKMGKIVPYFGIQYCCNYLGISPSDVDLWVVNACFKDAINILRQQLIGIPFDKIKDIPHPGHHAAHAYSTFYASPYKEAATLVLDVNGSFITKKWKENYSVYHGKEDHLTQVFADMLTPGEISIAELYVIYAALLQLSPKERQDYGDDDSLSSGGKLMGYAAHAHPDNLKRFVKDKGFAKLLGKNKVSDTPDPIPRLLETENHHYVVKIKKLIQYFKSKGLVKREDTSMHELEHRTAPPYDSIFGWDITKYVEWNYRKDSLTEIKNIKFGGEAQTLLEDAIVKMANHAYELTGSKNLCVAGGTMLNVVACTKILEQTPFENIFVQPASNDGGNAIGAAYYGYYNILNQKGRFYDKHTYKTYLGKQYPNQDVEDALNKNWVFPFEKKKIDDEDEMIKRILPYLVNNQVVAIFKGRSEFGPRALGSRSFLASPIKASMLDTMNDLKEREWYRPVAPIILEEEFSNYFDAPYKQSPFMTLMAYCNEKTIKEAPAVCHVDGSARPQTISEEYNPFIYRLLRAFQKETGMPILINTSFNVGEPIVEVPEHAINTFLASWQAVNCLVLENYILETNPPDEEASL